MSRYRKAVTAAIGVLVTFLYYVHGTDLVTEPYRTWILVVILTATATGVYTIPNTPHPYVLQHTRASEWRRHQ